MLEIRRLKLYLKQDSHFQMIPQSKMMVNNKKNNHLKTIVILPYSLLIQMENQEL